MARLSGLQRDVLSLYRQCLRTARSKPAGTRPHFEAYARHEFERSIALDKKDFGAIEFLLRKGHRQLETYAAPNITDIRRRMDDAAEVIAASLRGAATINTDICALMGACKRVIDPYEHDRTTIATRDP